MRTGNLGAEPAHRFEQFENKKISSLKHYTVQSLT